LFEDQKNAKKEQQDNILGVNTSHRLMSGLRIFSVLWRKLWISLSSMRRNFSAKFSTTRNISSMSVL
jgi:hypothetical protein